MKHKERVNHRRETIYKWKALSVTPEFVSQTCENNAQVFLHTFQEGPVAKYTNDRPARKTRGANANFAECWTHPQVTSHLDIVVWLNSNMQIKHLCGGLCITHNHNHQHY
jgi:hypothetical protein